MYIEAEAFASNKLTTVALPPQVVEIGENAFANNQLTSVELSDASKATFDKDTEIMAGAFKSNKLTSITLVPGTKVRNHAFDDNPIVEIVKPWTNPLDEEGFEKSFYEYYRSKGAETGLFKKVHGAWSRRPLPQA
jgi:Flp pilus assembly protein TadG